MAEIFPFGLSASFFIAATAMFVLFALMGLWAAEWMTRRQRLRSVVGGRSHRQGDAAEPGAGKPRARLIRFMRAVVASISFVKDKQAKAIKGEMYRAGLRSRDAIIVYAFLKITLPVAGAVAGFFGLQIFFADYATPLLQISAVLACSLAGSYLPDLYVKRRARSRNASILETLPDALDLMVICVESGISLDSALERVSKQIAKSSSALSDELAYTGLELRFLPERRIALNNLIDRADLASVRALVNTLTQSERYGTPLAKALRLLAREQRSERMMRAEEKAARLPATMTVPLIVFILPALFVVLLGPAGLNIVDSLSR
ncbi:type II secretion system F family protein [Fodinicurvata sp. EGI_FJ10296]|jgi:tight adherence protein C|uniref:type II secretion system F family protein n=1 Tax=Fodinicurvata sp. EGI_FJ10296 TaxID=3231908 RepID=UPI0034546069